MRLPGGGGLEKMLMKQMKKLQEEAERTQQELEASRVEASAGGGAVTAVANGLGEILELKLAPEIVDPAEIEMLQDTILAALREVIGQAKQLQQEKTAGLTGGMGLPDLF